MKTQVRSGLVVGVLLGALLSAEGALPANVKRQEKPVAKGVTLVTFSNEKQPMHAFMAKIDLKTSKLKMAAVNGSNKSCSRLKPEETAQLLKKAKRVPVVGTNADFFENSSSLTAGQTVRIAVSDGKLMGTGFLNDANGSNYLYENTDGEIDIAPLRFKGSVTAGGTPYPIIYVNTKHAQLGEDTASQPNGVGVFTAYWGGPLPGPGVLVKLAKPFTKGDVEVSDLKATVVAPAKAGMIMKTNDPLMVAIVGTGASVKEISALKPKSEVTLNWCLTGGKGKIRNAIGVWVEPMVNGVISDTHEEKNYPRTAFGMNKEKGLFALFVVDGRQPKWSTSLTSRQMAELMKEEGCDYVGQFDGGGSSALWTSKGGIVNGVKNTRAVGSSLFFTN